MMLSMILRVLALYIVVAGLALFFLSDYFK